MSQLQTRRRFLTSLPLAGAAALLPVSRSLAVEEPPETTTVRLPRIPSTCLAPQYLAEQLLRADGFTDVHWVDIASSAGFTDVLSNGTVDFTQHYVAALVTGVDIGDAVTGLAPIHVGCLELVASESVRTVADLRGRRVGIQGIGSSDHLFAMVTAAHIGLDPVRDISWLVSESPTPAELFAQGKLDAVVGSPTVPQDLRARRLGHVLANSTTDYPWSQYFCCILSGNRSFVRLNPVATKRVVRAFLMATDLCASQPARVAQRLVDGKFTPRYDYALQTLNEVPYNNWRDFDPDDSFRFYALRMRELGFIKSTPQKIIAEGTDWRFLNELKRELKS
jgi:NitT/TauT family transport system substrate-binding protein